MKIYGERILNTDLRFVFSVDGDRVSSADKVNIEKVNDIVADNLGGDASLADVIYYIKPLVESGEVRVSIESISDE